MIQPKNIQGITVNFTGYITRNKCAKARVNLGIYFGLNQAFRVPKACFSISSLTEHTGKQFCLNEEKDIINLGKVAFGLL